MKIGVADIARADIKNLLALHIEEAENQDCSHAFPIERLSQPDVYFFSARDDNDDLMGCAGLKFINEKHGEIKSVRTHPNHLRKGVSTALMGYLESFAVQNSLERLSLETHSTPDYQAARALYESLGYEYCDPFGDYTSSDMSVFMEKLMLSIAL